MPLQKDLKNHMSSETESIVKYLFSDCNVLFWPAHQQKTFKSFKCLKLAGNFIPWFLLTVFLTTEKAISLVSVEEMGHSVLNWTVPFIFIDE